MTRMRWRSLLGLVALAAIGLGLALPGPLHTFFFEENLQEVVPGQIWRSAQPDGREIDEMIAKLELRSVLNLRGERGGTGWLAAERAASDAHGVVHYTVRLDPNRLPPAQRLRQVVEVIDQAPRPLLFHCEGGVERSGLVAALAVLLAGGDLESARREFATAKGFVPWIAWTDLPRVLDEYEAWLAARGEAHSPDRLRAWVATGYAPYFYRAHIEPIDPPPALAPGRDSVLRFRVTNASLEPIGFRADRERGVHLGGFLRGPDAGAGPLELRSGFVDLALAPGASTELELPLPALGAPGRWQLHVDLVDEQMKWFADMGSTPLVLPIDVRADGSS